MICVCEFCVKLILYYLNKNETSGWSSAEQGVLGLGSLRQGRTCIQVIAC